jgi:transketolase
MKHNSMRGYFAYELLELMKTHGNIHLLVGDLGYGMFDQLREEFPDQFTNCGASEQAMLDIAVGMAYSGNIPVVYSITPFLIYRPFETLRTYINHENLPVKLVGAGRDKDYAHDGISHWADDTPLILSTLTNIKQYYPQEKEEITQEYVSEFVFNDSPAFLSLRR